MRAANRLRFDKGGDFFVAKSKRQRVTVLGFAVDHRPFVEAETAIKRGPRGGVFENLHDLKQTFEGDTAETEHRHALPLRLCDEEIAAFVESQPIRCSHYDAFRFFTPAARSFNLLYPDADSRAEMEQPGCDSTKAAISSSQSRSGSA